MKINNISYTLLNESDINHVNDFYNRIYRENRTYEKFFWEFFSGPAGKAVYIVARNINTDQIIGTQGAIPLFLANSQGKKILTAKSEDTLIDPKYRGQNIFENMYQILFEECKKDGIQYIWGFTSAKKPFNKVGFDTPFTHTQSMLVKDILQSYDYLSLLNPNNKLADKLKIFVLSALSKVYTIKSIFFNTSAIGDYSMDISTKNEISDLMPLLNSATTENIFFLYQDYKYLNWRIKENPHHTKIYNFCFFKNSDLVANIIFNLHKGKVWYLLQSLFEKKIPESHKIQMINYSIKQLNKNENIALIRSWNFHNNPIGISEISILKKSGFIHLNRGIHLVWKRLDAKEDILPENFLLSRMATQGVI